MKFQLHEVTTSSQSIFIVKTLGCDGEDKKKLFVPLVASLTPHADFTKNCDLDQVNLATFSVVTFFVNLRVLLRIIANFQYP